MHDTDTVVVYDAQGVYSSARAWWMLRAMGFDRAAVLDGGLPAWIAAGHLVERSPAAYDGPPGTFTARPRPGLIVDADTVAAALADPAAAVLDARSAGRYAGTAPEPRPGLRGGHMPGAKLLPFGELQRDGGTMRPASCVRRSRRRPRAASGCTSAVAPGSPPAFSRWGRPWLTTTSPCTTARGASGASPATGRWSRATPADSTAGDPRAQGDG